MRPSYPALTQTLSDTPLPRKGWWIIWLGVLLLAGAIYLTGLGREALWLDEAYTADMVRQTPIAIWRTALNDCHPPLYYLSLWGLVGALGVSPVSLRLLSVLGALALVLLGAGPVRRAWGAWGGLCFALLVVVTPIMLAMAQEARMYTWAAFFATATSVYAYLAAVGGRRWDFVALAASLFGAAYTHYWALVAAALVSSLVFAWVLVRRRDRAISFGLALVVPALLFLPWVRSLARQLNGCLVNSWISEINLSVIGKTFIYPFSFKFSRSETVAAGALAVGLLAALAVAGVVLGVRRRQPGAGLAVVGLAGYGLTFLSAIVLSYAVHPILVSRYIVPVLGLLLLPVAFALARVVPRPIALAAFGVLALIATPMLVQVQRERFNGPMDEVAAYVRQNLTPDDVFVHVSMHSLGPMAYYLPENQHFMYIPAMPGTNPARFFGPRVTFGSDIDAYLRGRSRVWLVGCRSLAECETAADWLAAGKLQPIGEAASFSYPYSWLAVSLIPVEQRARLNLPR